MRFRHPKIKHLQLKMMILFTVVWVAVFIDDWLVNGFRMATIVAFISGFVGFSIARYQNLYRRKHPHPANRRPANLPPVWRN